MSNRRLGDECPYTLGYVGYNLRTMPSDSLLKAVVNLVSEYRIETLAANLGIMDVINDLDVVWEEFALHNEAGVKYLGSGDFLNWFPEFQLAMFDDSGRMIARAMSAPIRWQGKTADLPVGGWTWGLENAAETHQSGQTPNAVTAIEVTVASGMQGKGLAQIMLNAMKDNAKRLGFKLLVAAVRPNMKKLYPLISLQDYITWTLKDGVTPFDHWLRVHWRAGGVISHIAHHSYPIQGTIAEWEEWTNLQMPVSGQYIINGGLVPVQIDYETGMGYYDEPNVWVIHKL